MVTFVQTTYVLATLAHISIISAVTDHNLTKFYNNNNNHNFNGFDTIEINLVFHIMPSCMQIDSSTITSLSLYHPSCHPITHPVTQSPTLSPIAPSLPHPHCMIGVFHLLCEIFAKLSPSQEPVFAPSLSVFLLYQLITHTAGSGCPMSRRALNLYAHCKHTNLNKYCKTGLTGWTSLKPPLIILINNIQNVRVIIIIITLTFIIIPIKTFSTINKHQQD